MVASYVTRYISPYADEWVRGFRDVPHAQQDTTGACEGFHSALKGNELAQKKFLRGRRVDWFMHEAFYEVSCKACSTNAYPTSSDAIDLAYSAGSNAEIALMSLFAVQMT